MARISGLRNLGTSGRVVVIAAAAVMLLIIVMLIVKPGCEKTTEPDQPADSGAPPEKTTVGQGENDMQIPPPPVVIDKAPDRNDAAKIYDDYRITGQEALDRGDYVKAREYLSLALPGIADPHKVRSIKVHLADIAKKLTFSPLIDPDDKTAQRYHTEAGEYPGAVAKKFDITPELFLSINKIPNEGSMRANRDYKVLKGPFHVVAHKKTFELDVYLGKYFVKSYAIGLGKNGSTPLGDFLVGDKLTNPPWYGTEENTGRRILVPFGDERNPLGIRWIGLKTLPDQGGSKTGYGIHGTDQPQSIGKESSNGCVRMRNDEVTQVYDMLIITKSRVTVLED